MSRFKRVSLIASFKASYNRITELALRRGTSRAALKARFFPIRASSSLVQQPAGVAREAGRTAVTASHSQTSLDPLCKWSHSSRHRRPRHGLGAVAGPGGNPLPGRRVVSWRGSHTPVPARSQLAGLESRIPFTFPTTLPAGIWPGPGATGASPGPEVSSGCLGSPGTA